MTSSNGHLLSRVAAALAAGFRFRWSTFAILVCVITGLAAASWSEDPRPFWHPLVTFLLCGVSIAYCVNVATPWASPRGAIPRLLFAVAVGAMLGLLLTIAVKGYSLDYILGHKPTFVGTLFGAFFAGLFVSLFFVLKHRETRAAGALHRAESERLRLSKYAVEAELKLMQAQVEPHFLFNTLASVQFLVETDPPQASRLLGHLLDYLRAALPQMRSKSTTLGREIEFAEAYLNILRMRMGPRLEFAVDVPAALRSHPFPPMLLISIVENAVTHGLEPQAAGGRVTIAARREGERLVVMVTDTGAGLSADARPGGGIGLTNIRERLATLYGPRGRFTLEDAAPHGARATIAIPLEAEAHAAAAANAAA